MDPNDPNIDLDFISTLMLGEDIDQLREFVSLTNREESALTLDDIRKIFAL